MFGGVGVGACLGNQGGRGLGTRAVHKPGLLNRTAALDVIAASCKPRAAMQETGGGGTKGKGGRGGASVAVGEGGQNVRVGEGA